MRNWSRRCGKSFACLLLVLLCMENLLFAQEKTDDASEAGIYMLCYHDIAKYIDDKKTPHVIAPEVLEAHILELRKRGYVFLSMQDYVAISRGQKSKPPKAVVMTFDDGYASFYETVYPILRKHRVPAMMAIIGSWMDGGAGNAIRMSTWEQFREMEASGLVTVASHTYDLHKPVYINDRGDMASAVSSRLYRAGIYESEEAYADRLRYDFGKAQKQLEENLGHRSAYLVWPYGDYNETALRLAREAGFKYAFQLGDGWNVVSAENLQNGNMLLRARRIMMYENLSAENLIGFMRSYVAKNRSPFRITRVDLASLYVPGNISQTDANIDMLVERLYASNVRRVVLNLAEDADGDGKAETVYFHNTQDVPIKADVANHFIGRLRAEGITVYAMIPASSAKWRISAKDTDDLRMTENRIRGLFNDMALYTPAAGIYFAEKNIEAGEFTALTDAIMADFRAVRMSRAVSVADVPLEALINGNRARNLLEHYDYLLTQIQPEEENVLQWEKTVVDALPSDQKMRDSIIFSFQPKDKSGAWSKAKALRHCSKALQAKGYYLFGFTQESAMEEPLWYLPNVYASESMIWKKYAKEDNRGSEVDVR